MARAKGISPNRVLWVHALRMSMLSLMTSVALQMAALLGGAVVAEQFFGPKGIGDRLVFAVQQNDLLVIQAIAAVLVVIVVFANLVVDLLYAVVDPRIRLARSLELMSDMIATARRRRRRRAATLHRRPTSTIAPAPADPDVRRALRRRLAGALALPRRLRRLPAVHPAARPARRGAPATTAFGPGDDFWFGSDRLGRDVFARCVYGARITLIIGVTSIVIGLVVGTTLGMIAGLLPRLGRPGHLDRHRRPAGVPGDHPRHPRRRARQGRCAPATSSSSASGSAGSATRGRITFVFALLSIAPISRIVRAQTLSLSPARVRAGGPQPRRQDAAACCSARSCPTSCRRWCR